MLGVFLAGAILMAGAAPASDATSAAKPVAAAKGTAQDPNAVICHSEAQSGTRLVTRTCMRVSEWRERQLQDRQNLNNAQGRYQQQTMQMMMGPT